jgi:hypothetical protein
LRGQALGVRTKQHYTVGAELVANPPAKTFYPIHTDHFLIL